MIAMRFLQLQNHLLARHRAGTLPHALLLTGPAGVGKQLLLDTCVQQWYPNARARVSSCIIVEPLAATDASKTKKDISIEQIRALRDMLVTSVYAGQERLVVITPAHRMSAGAANSLLKVLEEPPAHTRFILLSSCFTDVPVTIRSRCELMHVVPSPEEDVRHVLAQLGCDVEVVEEVAAESFGLVGLAHTLAQSSDARALHREQVSLLFELFGTPIYAQRPQLESYLGDGKDHVAQRRTIAALFDRWYCAAGAWLRTMYGAAATLPPSAQAAATRGVQASHVLGFMRTLEEARRSIERNIHPKLIFESLMFRLYAKV